MGRAVKAQISVLPSSPRGPKPLYGPAFARALNAVKAMPRHTLMPWSCNHHKDFSEIEAYVEGSGKREVITSVRSSAGVDAEIVAEFIALAINEFGKSRELIRHMAAALENCIECDLTWEVEHEADIMLRRAYQVVGRE